MPNDKSPPKQENVAQQETGGDCVSRLVVPLWIIAYHTYKVIFFRRAVVNIMTANGKFDHKTGLGMLRLRRHALRDLRHNVDVLAPAGEKTPTKPQDV